TGILVSMSGAIGFVGLVVPHAVRLIVGPGYRAVLPVSALGGAVLLLWADTLARTAFDPRALPVRIVTAVLGAPVFALLLASGEGGGSRASCSRPCPWPWAAPGSWTRSPPSCRAGPSPASSAPTAPGSRRCCGRSPASCPGAAVRSAGRTRTCCGCLSAGAP